MSDIDHRTIRNSGREHRRGISFFLAIFCAALLQGCHPASTANSPTAGLTMTMYVRDATGAEMYYEIDRHGKLSYGGGVKARLFQTTWSDSMTSSEIAQVRSVLESQNWFRPEPESTNQPPEHVYRVTIDAPERRKHFKVKGEHQALKPLHQILAKVALRRLEPTLRSLPEPSIRQTTTQPATQPGS